MKAMAIAQTVQQVPSQQLFNHIIKRGQEAGIDISLLKHDAMLTYVQRLDPPEWAVTSGGSNDTNLDVKACIAIVQTLPPDLVKILLTDIDLLFNGINRMQAVYATLISPIPVLSLAKDNTPDRKVVDGIAYLSSIRLCGIINSARSQEQRPDRNHYHLLRNIKTEWLTIDQNPNLDFGQYSYSYLNCIEDSWKGGSDGRSIKFYWLSTDMALYMAAKESGLARVAVINELNLITRQFNKVAAVPIEPTGVTTLLTQDRLTALYHAGNGNIPNYAPLAVVEQLSVRHGLADEYNQTNLYTKDLWHVLADLSNNLGLPVKQIPSRNRVTQCNLYHRDVLTAAFPLLDFSDI